MSKEDTVGLGCELTARGRNNLRLAIRTMLLVAVCGLGVIDNTYATASRGHREDRDELPQDDATNEDWIDVHPGDFPEFDWDPFPDGPDFSDSWEDGFIGHDSGGGGGGSDGVGVGEDENSDDSCPKSGNPVVLATGNKVEYEVDFTSSGELGLGLLRTYNHFWKGVGLFGKHWVSNLDYKLTFATTTIDGCYPRPGGGACSIGASGAIYAWRPDGRIIKYIKNITNGVFYEDKAGPVSTITVLTDGSFALRGEEGTYETYSPAGYVTTVGNGAGINWTFTYANGTYPYRVTHTSGRYIEFVWTNGQLTSVRDTAGSYYGYTYNANQFGYGLHRLSTSSRPGAAVTTTTYHYEMASDAAALTGKSFNGARYSTFTYDGSGRAISTEHNGQEKFTFSYADGADGLLTVLETNPLGKQATYRFENGKLTAITGHPSAHCAGANAKIVYDTNGYPATKSDFNGNTTVFTYNAKGQLTQKIEAQGTPHARTTQYVWDAERNRLVTETVLGVSRKHYVYWVANRPQSVEVTNLSTNGVANQARTIHYSYTDYGRTLPNGVRVAGMLASIEVDGPMAGFGDAVTTRYDNQGNLVSVANSLGHQTVYSNHNGRGQPGRVTSPTGAVIEYEYDARGRVVVERAFPNGSPVEKRYVYGASGLLDAITTSDDNTILYHYDAARRLIQEDLTEPGGSFAVKRYTYNAMSLPVKVEIGRGR